MSTVVCWFQRTLKQLEREQTDTQTDRQTDRQTDKNYRNPRACAPRVTIDIQFPELVHKKDVQERKQLICRVEVEANFSMVCSYVVND